MSALVDPHICPDCRAPLDAAGTCTGCGLRLVGPAAGELWQHMVQADRLIAQLRSAPVAAPIPGPAAPTGMPPAPARTTMPTLPVGPSASVRRHTLPSASVPVVLLSLGALCLLVAAIVFVAVAWGSLGLGAKTTILLAVTALFAGGAAAATRRTLRFAAETLWLVVAGLVAVDLTAAYHADLLGLARIGDRSAVALVGACLLGLAVAAGAWVTTTPLRRLHGLVVVAGIGTVLLAGAEAWTSEHNPGAVAISVPVIAAVALGIDRISGGLLRTTAVVVGAAAPVSWLVLVGLGLDRMATTATDRIWWSEFRGWPLLAAAALAALPAVLPSAPWAGPSRQVGPPVRAVAAGASLVTLGLFAAGPNSGPTADLLTWAVVSAALAGISAVAPRTWAWPAAALTSLALLVWTAITLVRPLDVITRLPATAPADHARLGLHLPPAGDGPAPWTALVSVLVIGAAVGGLRRHLPSPEAREAVGRAFIALGPGALALGATTWLLETEPTLVVAVLAWSGTVAITGAMAVTVRHHDGPLTASLVFGVYLIVVDLRLALASHLLSAIIATALAVVLAAAYARAGRSLLRGLLLPILAGSVVLLAGFAATHWPYPAGGREDAAALSLVGVATVGLLLARWVGRGEASRVTVEVAALGAGLVATAYPTERTTVAMVLTVLGTAVAVVSILHRDRDQASWIGLALLGVATAIRVVEDVRAPELYTLPAAALLIVAGWWRLGADPAVGSARALSSGLTLALLPSLLLALDEPVSLRGALIAAGGLAALVVGLARLWAAPFVAGALTTAVLAVRHLGPVVEGLPRWISLGAVGLLLLLVGVTWEQRRRDVQAASRYLASLR
jgi:hypothetical protein